LACYEAAARELEEEVRLIRADDPEALNWSFRAHLTSYPAVLLHDPDTAVGRRHLGLVYLINLPGYLTVRPREAAIRPVGWLDPAMLHGATVGGECSLEPWSLILARYMLGFDPARREALAPAGAEAVG
jgi:8-oxo-dGTP pyrophosphatase MutT (NUDIX family)